MKQRIDRVEQKGLEIKEIISKDKEQLEQANCTLSRMLREQFMDYENHSMETKIGDKVRLIEQYVRNMKREKEDKGGKKKTNCINKERYNTITEKVACSPFEFQKVMRRIDYLEYAL